jgi:hypothetical protein
MKSLSLSFWVMVCAIALAGSSHGAPGGGPQPSPCLIDAKIQITAKPQDLTYGQSTVIHWSVDLPAECSAVHARLNGAAVGLSGSQSMTPASTSTYTVLISQTHLGVYGERTASTVIPVTFPSRVVIDPGTANPVTVLLGALQSSNSEQTIELCDVDLDLTGVSEIEIGDNRSLIASPACARGPRSFGPRIFVTDHRGSKALFQIRGDNVLFSGFRLEGPTSGIGQGDDILEKGISIWPFASPAPIHHIEISNMEIFNWSGQGIQVGDNDAQAERGRLFNTNEGAVHIWNNFFHHNRHGAGDGYGVESAGGAYVLIERNVFDENRHAIAGGSRAKDSLDYSGYTARDNLILSGGGLHCSDSWYYAFCAWLCNCWHTHQIDMHGDQNEWYSSNNWECGTAGETMIIQRNTVFYTAGLAIKIRGNPADKAVVDGDVFSHGSPGDAIGQNGNCGFGDNITNPIDVRPNNVFGANPMAELGSCDFFGDGQQDKFMATGVTWWALSPVTLQWRYLNTMSERIPELQLQKVDADAVCDVAPRMRLPEQRPDKYSKSGTSPWLPLNVAQP